MTAEAGTDLDPLSRALVVIISAVTVLILFSTASLLFPDRTLARPGPEVVALGALATALVLPRVHEASVLGVRRLVRGATLTPYETLARVATRLESVGPVGEVIPSMIEVIESGVGADRVEITLFHRDREHPGSAGAGPVAAIGPSEHRATIIHDDRPIAEIVVHKRQGFNAQEVRLIDDVAASAGIAAANALAVAELDARAAELDSLVQEIEDSRRQMVIAEQQHRERLAGEVIALVDPIFDDLRSEVTAGRFDDAATLVEELIGTLRSISASVIETGAR